MKHHHVYDAGSYYLVQIGTHPNRVRKTFSALPDALAFRDDVLAKLPPKPEAKPKPVRKKRAVNTKPGPDVLATVRLDSSAPSGLSWTAGTGKQRGHAGWVVPGGYAVRVLGTIYRCAVLVAALQGPTMAERIAQHKKAYAAKKKRK